jgi:hypothetical protein
VSAFLDLRDLAVSALTGAPALAGGFVKPGRMFALPEERSQGIFVRLARARGATPFAGDLRTDWETELVLHLTARAAVGGDGEDAVDELVDAVYARMAAAAPPPQSDGWLLEPSVAFEVDEADQTIGHAELRLRLKHRTAAGSLAAAA